MPVPIRHACTRCGQTYITRTQADAAFVEWFVCEPCREDDRAPQGETVRLFTPLPPQLAGQTIMDVCCESVALSIAATLPFE